jgi:hypothetical protein
MLCRIFRLTVLACLFLLCGIAAGAVPLKLVIGVSNRARVSSEILQAAFVRAHDAFSAAGLETEWRIRDGNPPVLPEDLVLWILPGVSRVAGSPSALGAARFEKNNSRALWAEVFYQAVRDQVQSDHQCVMLLSNVIAHEVGHLLLGRTHTPDGLMGANWSGAGRNLAQSTALRFDSAEMKRLRWAVLVLRSDAALRAGVAPSSMDSGLLEGDEKRIPR